MEYQGFGIVYRITNKQNNKSYVGRTTRKFNERYPSGEWWKYTHSVHLRNSVEKYGYSSFSTEILKICIDDHDLIKSEVEFIQQFDSVNCGYNQLANDLEYLETAKYQVHKWTNKEKVTLSEFIKAGHARRTPESKLSQYANAEITRNSRDPDMVKADYAARASKRKAYYDLLPKEEREAKLKAKNEKIKETLLARDDNYEARVAKRLSRSPEEQELSEVKRILDRFGPSWQPGNRSKWFLSMEKFHSLAALIAQPAVVQKPVVIVVAGQCGVGKSWVCRQLTSCGYVSYDKAREKSYELIDQAIALHSVVVFEAPIRSKAHLRNLAEKYQVYYAVVFSDEQVVIKQLEGRGSTRLSNVAKMNIKYKKYAAGAAFAGSSSWMLTQLQGLVDDIGRSSLGVSQV